MNLTNAFFDHWWMILIFLIIIFILVFVIADFQMDKKISEEISLLMIISDKNQQQLDLITKEDTAGLPEPVQKWLEYSGVIGQNKIKTLSFSQQGKMRLDPEQENWLDAEAEQYINVKEPGYLWHVDLPIMPLINTKGRDLFYQGKASMEIKIGSIIPVVNAADNKKLNESSYHRFLLELPWYPTAALEDYISWQAVDEQSAKAVLSYQGTSVEATFYFEKDGKLQSIEALRYKENDDNAKRIPCIGEVKEYMTVEGFRIPNRINVTWMIDDEPYTWYKLEIFDVNLKRG